ncbi:hypothetical protein [Pengzhenrongella frigida]|uniref:GGDEF domain-containing protein n=1 Tax=Pengzhenrongella frigida TaxID=1259133 RepID=A0A4Q5MV43_9MICO|nr:hypothetical protein [Cellulomonas sp. HLT2-17]RYV49446.1 hypothetical protein EUA98_18745 [Cellulomonas sp. HLT2-17]
MTSLDATAAGLPPALREQWRAISAESVWLRPADWYHPAIDAVVEAALRGTDTSPAAARLGAVRGENGVGIVETIDDFACLFRSLGTLDPPLGPMRALCEGWVAAQDAAPAHTQCLDPETGLPTAEYLRVRLAETYGVAARAGHAPTGTHSLLLVDVAVAELDPWSRIARSAVVGQVLALTYGEGHPMASLGDGTFAILVERNASLGTDIARLRDELVAHADRLAVTSLVRQPPRIWLEALPETHAGALDLLAHVAR